MIQARNPFTKNFKELTMANPVQDAKTAARAEDKEKKDGITSLTGKALEG